mgnify:CR=1 FL=1|jgi:hypothetical protein
MAIAHSRPIFRWAVSSFIFASYVVLAGCSSSDNDRTQAPQRVGVASSSSGSVPSTSSSSSSSSSSASSSGVASNPGNLRDADGNPVFVDVQVVNPTLEPQGATAIHLNFVNDEEETVPVVGTWKATSPCLDDGLAEISAPTATANRVSFNYTTRGCVGEDVVTFTTPEFTSVSYSATVTINDEVSYISWVSNEPSNIAISGSGGVEKATVTFRLNGSYGEAVAGQTVNFRLEGLAGDNVRLVDTTAISNSEGLVSATVISGSMPNVVTVVARHEASGNEAPSGGLVVATGLPSADHFNIALDKRSINAWNRINEPVTNVTIAVTDRVGNPVVDGTVVNFVSPDAGSVPSHCVTTNNTCTVEWKPDGRNPENGRARILATVKGTENFIDANGNNVFDEGDTFNPIHDLGEPYVDLNNTGSYEPGDYFVDTNRSGTRDEGDSLWNGLNCQHPTLCSDTVRFVDLGIQTVVYMSIGANAGICEEGDFDQSSFTATIGSIISLNGLYLSDGNGAAQNSGNPCTTGNALPAGTEISFSVSGGGTLEGKTSWTVPDNVGLPTGPYSVRFKAGNAAGSGLLTLKIAVPEEEPKEFYWTMDVTP